MWWQSSPPMTNRWLLHVAAARDQVADVLREMCIDEQVRWLGDLAFPVYLRGSGSPYGPPDWMAFARAELGRRGYATHWCDTGCALHPWPPRPQPEIDRRRLGCVH